MTQYFTLRSKPINIPKNKSNRIFSTSPYLRQKYSFTTADNILKYICLENAPYLTQVIATSTIIEYGKNTHHYKAQNVILCPSLSLHEISTLVSLQKQGACLNIDPLIEFASKNGNISLMKLLINNSINIDKAFIYAVKYNQIDMSTFLLSIGADVHTDNNMGVQIACKENYLQILTLCLNFGADISSPDNLPLHLATYYGNEQITKLILSISSDKSTKCLQYATQSGNEQMIKFLINEGLTLDINYSLIVAVKYNHLHLIKYLISNGAMINFNDDLPFKIAINNNFYPMIKLLIKCGANIHAENSYGIKYASYRGSDSLVKILIKFNANISIGQNYPIRTAAKNGFTNIVRLLLSAGADSTDLDNYSIKWASRNGHESIVRLLITETKTDISAENNYAVRWASRNGFVSIVKLLINMGADITTEDCYSLRWACINAHEDMVELLIKAGSDVSIRNNFSLRWACIKDHRSLIAKLIFNGNGELPENLMEREFQGEASYAMKYAIWRGNIAQIQLLIESGLDIGTKNNFLKYAIFLENKEITSLLIENGADITNIDFYRGNYSTEMISFLITYGLDITLGDNALINRAYLSKNHHLIQLLESAGTDFICKYTYKIDKL